MSDIKIFRIGNSGANELKGSSVALEKSLQTLIEKHLEIFLGVRFLASEYSTGAKHGGRIDTLGIDENDCPVIIEYKRALNENVINQGLYYLDWLLDHKAEFKLLVMKELGQEVANQIEWSSPRLLCIAGDFNKYDEHAVQRERDFAATARRLRLAEIPFTAFAPNERAAYCHDAALKLNVLPLKPAAGGVEGEELGEMKIFREGDPSRRWFAR
jgi:hypothetical protein